MENGDDTRAALRLYRQRQELVCDSIEPWEHGVVVRASRYPDYWDFNLIRVEDDPGMGAEALAMVADRLMAGQDHRRFDFEIATAGEAVRSGLEALGWRAARLLWMRREDGPPAGAGLEVLEVPYDDVVKLRVAWHREDFPDVDPGDYHANAREVAMRLNARVFAVERGGEPVAFAQLEGDRDVAEITQVYVHPDERGNGIGTAMTTAAMHAAADVRDLWICADDEDRPKQLYSRLGFRPAHTTVELTRLPDR